MAKKKASVPATKPKQQQTGARAVAAVPKTDVPATIAEQIAQDAGKGVSLAQEDNLVPLIYVLQPLSPQADESDSRHLPGAKPGMIWLKNAAEPVIDGSEGIVFQPCFFQKNWVEWIPRDKGGGLVGITDECPKEAQQVKDGNLIKYIMPNGNEVKETRYHFGFVHIEDQRLPYCIPLTSTGHTVSRDLTSRMRSKVVNGVRAPSWAYLYKLTTISKQNKKGKWFQFNIEDLSMVDDMADYTAGRNLYKSMEKGEKKAALDEDGNAADSGAGDDDKM